MPDLIVRYAFRSTEKVALQEIGPRFTLKLRWMKKGIPAVHRFGEEAQPLEFDIPSTTEEGEQDKVLAPEHKPQPEKQKKTIPPKQDEFIWAWKVSKFYHAKFRFFFIFLFSRN